MYRDFDAKKDKAVEEEEAEEEEVEEKEGDAVKDTMKKFQGGEGAEEEGEGEEEEEEEEEETWKNKWGEQGTPSMR